MAGPSLTASPGFQKSLKTTLCFRGRFEALFAFAAGVRLQRRTFKLREFRDALGRRLASHQLGLLEECGASAPRVVCHTGQFGELEAETLARESIMREMAEANAARS